MTDPVLRDGAATYTPGISERRGSTTRFLHAGLKNVQAQGTVSQTLGATRVYDAFGNVTASSGTWQGPFGYGGTFGYQEDASGLQLLGHRLYDSSTGRFLTRDPIKDGQNWYVYCDNDPVNLTDQEGLQGRRNGGRIGHPKNTVYERLVQAEVDGIITDAEAAMGLTNYQRGLVGVQKLIADLVKEGVKDYATEVIINFVINGKPVQIRADVAWVDEDGNVRIGESKFGKNGRLTPNQRIAFPEMISKGGIKGTIGSSHLPGAGKGKVVKIILDRIVKSVR